LQIFWTKFALFDELKTAFWWQNPLQPNNPRLSCSFSMHASFWVKKFKTFCQLDRQRLY